MILLYTHKKINFTDLQNLLGLTPGNLGHHLKKLESADYVTIYKAITPFRPITMVKITSLGLDNFKVYIENLKDLLNDLDRTETT